MVPWPPLLDYGDKMLQGLLGNNSDGWFFVCRHPNNDCGTSSGDPNTSYVTSGWPTEELALKRGTEHLREHDYQEVMSTLDEFRKANKVFVTEDGKAVV